MKKKEEKKPLDMTTDEAMEYLLGQEGAKKLKEGARPIVAPEEKKASKNVSAKSSRKE